MFGQKELFRAGNEIIVLASPPGEWLPIGITLDWSLVAALGSNWKSLEGITYQAGIKLLRYGQVVTKITAAPVQTLTITGTGGTYALSGYRPDTGAFVTTAALAYNALAAAILAALTDAAVFGPQAGLTVTGTGPWVITGNVGVIAPVTGGLTGGSATIAQTTPVANSGMWGPYDSTASDGRQTLTRGNVGILNRTATNVNPLPGLTLFNHDHPAVLTGGVLFKDRVIATTGSASLAAGPTFATLEPVLTSLQWVTAAP